MKVEYRDGLLFTSLEITYMGKSKVLDNMVIDTGAAQSLISQACVDDIGVKFTGKEEIVSSYGVGGKEHAFVKKVDSISIGGYSITDFEMDFTGASYGDINGLIGLDLLMDAGYIIDLKKLAIYR